MRTRRIGSDELLWTIYGDIKQNNDFKRHPYKIRTYFAWEESMPTTSRDIIFNYMKEMRLQPDFYMGGSTAQEFYLTQTKDSHTGARI